MEQTENNYRELPQLFLIELMNAYGMSTGILSQYEQASWDEAEMMFDEAKRNIAQIWQDQDHDWKVERGYRILDKNENLVRSWAFADYLKLIKYDQNGFLQKEREDVWGDELLLCGTWEYILEDKCKDTDYGSKYKRNICFLRLLTYFLKHHKISEEVAIYIYKKYKIEAMKGRYYEKFYLPIQEELKKQYPDLKERLQNVVVVEDGLKNWKKQFFAIGADLYPSYFEVPAYSAAIHTYHTREIEVPHEIIEEVDRMLQDPLFEEHMYEDSFIEEMERHCVLQQTIPFIVDRIYEEYTREDRKERSSIPIVQDMIEGLVVRKGFWKLHHETNCYEDHPYDMSCDSKEFWIYFLMYAYGRPYDVLPCELESGFYYEKFCVRGTKRYLTDYMINYYRPSREWCMRFTGMKQENGEIIEKIKNVRTEEIELCDGRKVSLEYRPNQICFTCEGEPVNKANLNWQQFLEEVQENGSVRRFMLLLAITSIQEEERKEAKELIKEKLSQLPINEVSLPFISTCLANNNGYDHSDPEKFYPYIEENKGPIQEQLNVSDLTDLEKAEQMIVFLERNQADQEVLDAFLEEENLPEFAKAAYRTCKGLMWNHIVLHWGNQDRDLLYPVCVTGLFGLGEQLSDYYEFTNYYLNEMQRKIRNEESFPVGWIWPKYCAPILIVAGESGGLYIKSGLASARRLDNLAELIADQIPLADVTEFIHYNKDVKIARYRPGDGCVYEYRERQDD